MARHLPDEILQKVRRIEISTRKIVTDIMTGQYKSQFKGHGMQFSEHRQYMPGDDVRHMDWKVSARTREPLIKKYEEERELTVLLLVDISGSEQFGSSRKLKSEIAAEIGGMLAYAAIHTGDRVGAVLFAGEVEKIVPPKKGRSHVLRIVTDLLNHEPKTRGTSYSTAFDAAGRLLKHAGVVFILSDFIGGGYEVALRRLARRHDVVAIHLQDQRESGVPNVGTLCLEDPETGEIYFVDSSSYSFTQWLKSFRRTQDESVSGLLKSGRVEELPINTEQDYGEAVVRFFRARNGRRR
jgi:uncharacterized protein (DUF58 family)